MFFSYQAYLCNRRIKKVQVNLWRQSWKIKSFFTLNSIIILYSSHILFESKWQEKVVTPLRFSLCKLVNQVVYLHTVQTWWNISIHLESCFWKTVQHSPSYVMFTSLYVQKYPDPWLVYSLLHLLNTHWYSSTEKTRNFQRELRGAQFQSQILVNFYRGAIDHILTTNIGTVQNITGTHLPASVIPQC